MLFDTRYFWAVFASRDQQTTNKLRDLFDRSKSPCASAITIYEVSKLALATEGKDVANLRVSTIERDFDVVDVDSEVAEEGALISHRLRIPMADSLIMATSKRLHLPCVTDDPHFSEVKTVWI
jgi:predicted nucleic acid-binding protein